MTISKRTIVQKIEITADGCIYVESHMQLAEDGKTIATQDKHAIALAPDMDCDAALSAINAHITGMGYSKLEGWDRVKAHAEIARTPEVLKACAAAREAQKADMLVRIEAGKKREQEAARAAESAKVE